MSVPFSVSEYRLGKKKNIKHQTDCVISYQYANVANMVQHQTKLTSNNKYNVASLNSVANNRGQSLNWPSTSLQLAAPHLDDNKFVFVVQAS